ncbi:DegT/DnrJ/EryC1/StrS family aminotransferase [Pseudobacteriovorax antillogorgiicola]|uniref:dTDP-4-amino-4,6-dideoxygalactose transaminase n=1 Tax=Pseudobacteriovorax antillogorgiicola TaxID=1513793 RepID=A0A1Y6CFF0_9BACT|nr:DegT/DnrJ/EryC1/StrS family aminotransferase [Pseudobacteriovorax antillogorgiicola]TCS47259.1 dTDP-4-amino-4,6-dideoxygalactose transaminase [Pseudobacteriovorax antillogorgiicola]SMF62097.1 dTDP-4-amino-4,6-dideoxygalactose transaminase [Pseudobacteriovorax antillogorgiicola]
MRVPFIDLSRSIKLIREQVLNSWETALDNCEFVGGPAVASLEKKLEKRLDVSHFVGCSNGTDAIVVGLQALGVKPGMRVAVPNMTFWAPYEAIVQVGAIPVLVDIDPDDLQMSIDEFKEGHKNLRFDAAIFVHLFGWSSARLKELRTFCEAEEIILLEDGAQSFGVKVEGQSVYSGAALSTISFYPAKVLGGSGDGGGIMTPNPKTDETIRALCNHGRAGHYTYDYVGWNCRMGGLNGHYMNHMLDIIDDLIEQRLKAEQFYQDFLSDYPKDIRVYRAPQGVEGNGYLSMIAGIKKSGDELAAGLKSLDIGCARTYPQTLCEQPPAAKAMRTSDLRHSKEFSQRVINLPLFAGITMEECKASAEALRSLF